MAHVWVECEWDAFEEVCEFDAPEGADESSIEVCSECGCLRCEGPEERWYLDRDEEVWTDEVPEGCVAFGEDDAIAWAS